MIQSGFRCNITCSLIRFNSTNQANLYLSCPGPFYHKDSRVHPSADIPLSPISAGYAMIHRRVSLNFCYAVGIKHLLVVVKRMSTLSSCWRICAGIDFAVLHIICFTLSEQQINFSLIEIEDPESHLASIFKLGFFFTNFSSIIEIPASEMFVATTRLSLRKRWTELWLSFTTIRYKRSVLRQLKHCLNVCKLSRHSFGFIHLNTLQIQIACCPSLIRHKRLFDLSEYSALEVEVLVFGYPGSDCFSVNWQACVWSENSNNYCLWVKPLAKNNQNISQQSINLKTCPLRRKKTFGVREPSPPSDSWSDSDVYLTWLTCYQYLSNFLHIRQCLLDYRVHGMGTIYILSLAMAITSDKYLVQRTL